MGVPWYQFEKKSAPGVKVNTYSHEEAAKYFANPQYECVGGTKYAEGYRPAVPEMKPTGAGEKPTKPTLPSVDPVPPTLTPPASKKKTGKKTKTKKAKTKVTKKTAGKKSKKKAAGKKATPPEPTGANPHPPAGDGEARPCDGCGHPFIPNNPDSQQRFGLPACMG